LENLNSNFQILIIAHLSLVWFMADIAVVETRPTDAIIDFIVDALFVTKRFANLTEELVSKQNAKWSLIDIKSCLIKGDMDGFLERWTQREIGDPPFTGKSIYIARDAPSLDLEGMKRQWKQI
jgi:hypothetical protein